MIIKGVEVNRDNTHDWSADKLYEMQGQLRYNIKHNYDDVDEEKLMIKLMDIEIKRQKAVNRINFKAATEKNALIELHDKGSYYHKTMREIKEKS